MSEQSPVTIDDVRYIHAQHIGPEGSKDSYLPVAGPRPAGWNARQSTRTEVHALLQSKLPPARWGDPSLWRQADRLVADALGAQE